MRWTAEELARQTGGSILRRGNRPVEGVFIDSRSPVIGGLFVPIVAARDGHEFVEEACRRGASGVLVAGERRPQLPDGDVTIVAVDDTLAALHRLAATRRAAFSGPVVAITGSNGKTTTRALISAALESAFERVLYTQGNLNNHLGVPLTLLGAPDDPQAMVIEMGMSAPGENAMLASLVRPTIVVITSIAVEHFEFMGSLEAIAAAEAEPLSFLPRDGAIIVPSDTKLLDPHLRNDGPSVLRFGPGHLADVEVVEATQDERTRAILRCGGRRFRLELQTFGLHNAHNAAAAVAVGSVLGLPLDPLVEALQQVEPVGDRGRTHQWNGHLVIADCYNANPGSMETAMRSLGALRSARQGRLIAVLGDMLELGPRARDFHRDVGALAGEIGLDAVAGVGPCSAALVEAAAAAGVEARHFTTDELDAAAQWAGEQADRGTPGAILFKGSRGIALERAVRTLLNKDSIS
jgi:UDP-N-acetylmuramoyl-tripeptide--D-alanyl-D-alanine ligase